MFPSDEQRQLDSFNYIGFGHVERALACGVVRAGALVGDSQHRVINKSISAKQSTEIITNSSIGKVRSTKVSRKPRQCLSV